MHSRDTIFNPQRRDTVRDLADLLENCIQPGTFFETNFITEGMRTLLEQALRRLEGKSSQGVFKVRQAMGGGKTHNLLVLGLLNLRYKHSVEDRVHELLSGRLQGIYQLFGQIPDVLEDAWIAVAQGEREQAKKIIDELPKAHPFEIKYTQVEPVDWESCRQVLAQGRSGGC